MEPIPLSLPLPLPSIDLVYNKTAAGRDEVAQRGAGLNARQRAALIMFDGRREARLLATIMPLDEVAPVLATLLALGLLTAARHAPESLALAAIKGELADLAESYLGVMAGDVVMRVRQAGDAAQLMRVLGQWHMAMQASKHGKDAAAALLEKTKAALHGTALA